MAYLFKHKTGKRTNNYLDDFLFAALLKALCDGHVHVFLDLCKCNNFPVALDKTFWGCQLIVFLGITLDTLAQRVIAKFSNPKLKQHHHVKVDSKLCSDLEMWIAFLSRPEAVSRPFMNFSLHLTADQLDFFTDASGAKDKGFGCIFGTHWTCGF